MTETTCDPRPYLHHQALAFAWCSYNSATGKVSDARLVKTMERLSVETLTRMLAERGITVKG